MTVSGNWDTSGVDTLDEGTSSVTFTGASKTITTVNASRDFYTVVVSGSYSCNLMDLEAGGSLTVTGTLTISTSLSIYSSADFTGGTVDGAGSMNWDTTSTLAAAGTINLYTQIRQSCTIEARTFGDDLVINPSKNSPMTFTFGAGSLTITGDLIWNNVRAKTYSVDFTANPTVNVTNVNLADTTGTFEVDMGGSTWTVSGNVTFAGVDTLTPGTATFTMTGSGKTLTLGGNAIANLTINSAGTVSFVDAATISGTLDLDAGTLDMNGQIADLTNITSSGGIITFGSATHTISGDVDLSGLSSYTATYLTFDGTGTQSIDLAAGTVTTVEVTNASDVVTFTNRLMLQMFCVYMEQQGMKLVLRQ